MEDESGIPLGISNTFTQENAKATFLIETSSGPLEPSWSLGAGVGGYFT